MGPALQCDSSLPSRLGFVPLVQHELPPMKVYSDGSQVCFQKEANNLSKAGTERGKTTETANPTGSYILLQ